MDLLKAAVVYGDEVLVHSPLASMMAGLASIQSAGTAEILDFMREVAPALQRDGQFVTAMETLEASYGPDGTRALAALMDGNLPVDQSNFDLRTQLELVKFREGWAALRAQLQQTTETTLLAAGADLVLPAIDANVLGILPVELDGDIANTYLPALEQLLRDPAYHPLLDEGIADLVKSAVDVGAISLTPHGKHRSRAVGAANSFLARLPTFPRATMDEIIDIRAELGRPLVRFRAEMGTVAVDLGVDSHDPAFREASATAWLERVQPALVELEELVEEKRLLRTFGPGDVTTAGAAATSLITGLVTSTPSLLAGAAVAGAVTSASIAHKRRALEQEIQRRPYYLLHLANERLR